MELSVRSPNIHWRLAVEDHVLASAPGSLKRLAPVKYCASEFFTMPVITMRSPVVGSTTFKRFALVSSMRSAVRSEEHTSELQSRSDLVCRLLLEKKKQTHLH